MSGTSTGEHFLLLFASRVLSVSSELFTVKMFFQYDFRRCAGQAFHIPALLAQTLFAFIRIHSKVCLLPVVPLWEGEEKGEGVGERFTVYTNMKITLEPLLYNCAGAEQLQARIKLPRYGLVFFRTENKLRSRTSSESSLQYFRVFHASKSAKTTSFIYCQVLRTKLNKV